MRCRLPQLLPALPLRPPLLLLRAATSRAAAGRSLLPSRCCCCGVGISVACTPLSSSYSLRAAFSTTTSSSISASALPSAPAVASAGAQTKAADTNAAAAPAVRLRLRERLRLRVLEGRRRWRDYAVVALAGAGSLLVASQAADLVLFLDSIQHRYRLELAFLSGGVVVAASLLFFSAARRCIPLYVPPLYRLCLRRLRQDAALQRALGSQLTFGPSRASSSPSGFRVVNLLPAAPRWRRGSASVQYWGWERYWKPRRLQLLMTVRGETGSGVLLAELEHRLDGRSRIRWLALEQIVSTAPAEERQQGSQPSQQPLLPQPGRLVLEQDGGGWSDDVTHSYTR